MAPGEETESQSGEPGEDWRRSWRRWSTWIAITLGSLLLYLFIYPIPLLYLDDPNGIDLESHIPDWLYQGIGITAAPLVWVMDAVPAYGRYIELVDEWVTK